MVAIESAIRWFSLCVCRRETARRRSLRFRLRSRSTSERDPRARGVTSSAAGSSGDPRGANPSPTSGVIACNGMMVHEPGRHVAAIWDFGSLSCTVGWSTKVHIQIPHDWLDASPQLASIHALTGLQFLFDACMCMTIRVQLKTNRVIFVACVEKQENLVCGRPGFVEPYARRSGNQSCQLTIRVSCIYRQLLCDTGAMKNA